MLGFTGESMRLNWPPTDEEWAEMLADPPDPPPPSAYPLGSHEGRCGFLDAYIWRGEEALFESVNHAWNSLSEPRGIKCIYIGMYAGTGGSGKWALAKMLRQALREFLEYDPMPLGEQCSTIDEYHALAMDFWAGQYAHERRVIDKYADILNGEPGRHAPLRSQIIQGPWLALAGRPND